MDLESRISRLESKEFYWDIILFVGGVVIAAIFFRIFPNIPFLFVLAGYLIGLLLYSIWGWIKPFIGRILRITIVAVIIIGLSIGSALNQYHQSHPNEQWSFATWSFVPSFSLLQGN